MSQLHAAKVDLTVVIGRTVLPLRQLLRMGRGATLPLGCDADPEVWILADSHPIARGRVEVGERGVSVRITGPADPHAWAATG
jgi:flagellar motor switch protein FliN/FliY